MAWTAGGIVLVAVLVFAGWKLTSRSGLTPSLPGAAAPAAHDDPAVAAAMARGKFNVILQVRMRDSGGGMAPVGAVIPSQLTLKFRDAEGRTYLERFDRVGLWAVDVPPGEYWVPPDQDELGEWKWEVSGEGLVRDGAKGWKFALTAGTTHFLIDLLLH